MAVHRVDVADEIRHRLGPGLLAEVTSQLWARDCQTCVRPLAARAAPEGAALVIDEMDSTARASLHHPACRPSQWNGSGVIRLTGGRAATFTSGACLLTLEVEGDSTGSGRPTAIVLVNPALEAVQLERGAGGWELSRWRAFAPMGLKRPGELRIGEPVPDAVAHVIGARLVIELGGVSWTASSTPEILETITHDGGLLLLLTSAVDPTETPLSHALLGDLAGRDDVAFGWVPAATQHDNDPAPSARALEHLLDPCPLPPPAGASRPPASEPGPTYDPATGQFTVGYTSDGGPVPWTLNIPDRGLEHGLIAGPGGCGKSAMLRLVLVEAAISGRFEVLLADPRDNGLADELGEAAPPTARDPATVVDLLGAVVDLLRAPAPGNGFTPSPEAPGLFVVLDDAETVLRDRRAAAHARAIVERGGPHGIGLVVATGSLDPGDFSGDVALIAGLAATNSLPLHPDYFQFLQALVPPNARSADR